MSGRLRASGTVRIQALGMVGLVVLGLLALAISPDVGVYLVATGWLFHGVWDFVHLRLDRVVVRSYAEWCGVLDVPSCRVDPLRCIEMNVNEPLRLHLAL